MNLCGGNYISIWSPEIMCGKSLENMQITVRNLSVEYRGIIKIKIKIRLTKIGQEN
jgi:hypothetical protein